MVSMQATVGDSGRYAVWPHDSRVALAMVAAAVTIVAAYWGVWNFGFVWDDYRIFLVRPEFRTELWPQAIFSAFPVSDNYFRPLALLTFVAELHWFDASPGPMHVTNLLLHIINTLLVGLLAARLAGAAGANAWPMAATAALVYGLHPALVEVAAWISGRFDLLVTLFTLLGLWIAGAKPARRWQTPAIILCFLAAAGSKEMAITMPLLVLGWRWLLFRLEHPGGTGYWWRGNVRLAAGLVGAGLFYLLIRAWALGHLTVNDSMLIATTPLERALLTGKSFLWYLWLTFWPFKVSAPLHEAPMPVQPTDLAAWSGLLALVVTIAVVGWLGGRRGHPMAILSTAYLVALFPVLHVLKPLTIGANIVHDRFLALPLVFASIAAALVFIKAMAWMRATAPRVGPAMALPLVFWLFWAGMNTHVNSRFWSSDIVLWNRALQTQPDSATALGNLAASYLEQGRYDLGFTAAERALDLTPDKMTAQANYALALKGLGRHAEAREKYEEILRRFGENADILNNLGVVSVEMGNDAEARPYFERAVALSPRHWRALINLSRLEKRSGRDSHAEAYLVEALKWAPPGSVSIAESQKG